MNGLYTYLSSLGLLEPDTPESLIESAKKTYRLEYNRKYQKQYEQTVRRINVRFEPEDFEKIEQSAILHQQKISPHIRSLALAYLQQTFLVPNKELIQSLQLDVKRIGTNFNQITRYLNTYKKDANFNPHELRLLIYQLEQVICDRLEHPSVNTRTQIKQLLTPT